MKAESNKKKASSDVLVESLNRIETTVQEQRQLLAKLVESQSQNQFLQTKNSALEALLSMPAEQPEQPKRKIVDVDSPKPELTKGAEFEFAFLQFVEAYNKLEQSEKPEKIRRVMRNTTRSDTEQITEMLDLFAAEGMENGVKKDQVVIDNTDGEHRICICEDCPHKRELEKIDRFYNEFLCTPSFDM